MTLRPDRTPVVAAAALPDALRSAVMRLARQLRQLRDESLGLTASQLSAMGVLLSSGDQRIGELARLERVQPPSMTRIVDALEAGGQVERHPDPHDRRHCVVALTSQGREVLMANRRRRSHWLAARLADLDPDEREVLARAVGILERITHA